MLFGARPVGSMGTEQLHTSRHFPQWSRTAILTIAGVEDDDSRIKTSPSEANGSGFVIGGDTAARVAHLEHSVRFLQEQHRQMLSGLHTEIEALRERNRDLQFQLIFNKESSPKKTPAPKEPNENSEEANLKREVSRLESEVAATRNEAAAARSEARAAEARALQLQRLLDEQTEKVRSLEGWSCECAAEAGRQSPGAAETRAELRARLGDAEQLVRRLRADADRSRRELQCLKSSLHSSLRASALDGFSYLHSFNFASYQRKPEFWPEPPREEPRRRPRRPVTLPELSGQHMHGSTVYVNHHTRPRANGHEHKTKKGQGASGADSKSTSVEKQKGKKLYLSGLETGSE